MENYEENSTNYAEAKRRIIKNLIVCSSALALVFTSISGLTNLQSSLFIDQGLGVVCQSVTYISLAAASLLLPKICISKLGHKWTLVTSIYGQVFWVVANGYATWLTMIIASIIQGITGALLWSSFGSYIYLLATEYTKLTRQDNTRTVSLFFGIGFGILKTSRLTGSVMSWAILQDSMKNSSYISNDDIAQCGASDCPGENVDNAHYTGPPEYLLWTLVGIFVIVGITSIVLVTFLLDDLPREASNMKSSDIFPKSATAHLLLSAAKLHKDVKQILIIPTCLYIGMFVSFIQADYNKSYVTCTLGIWMVGLLMIPNSILSITASFLSGKIGRIYIQFIFCTLVDLGLLLVYLLWKPNPDSLILFFIISSIFGITTSIWHAQFNAFVGIIFPDKETALANCLLWQSIGFAVSFGMSKSVCVNAKLYIIMAMLTLGTTCLIALKIHQRWHAKVVLNRDLQ